MSVVGSVLVLTHPFDPTADKVVDQLNRRGVSVFRCDAADFPEQLSAGAELLGGRWPASCGHADGVWNWTTS